MLRMTRASVGYIFRQSAMESNAAETWPRIICNLARKDRHLSTVFFRQLRSQVLQGRHQAHSNDTSNRPDLTLLTGQLGDLGTVQARAGNKPRQSENPET